MQLIILCDKYSLHAFFLSKFQPVFQAKGETGGASGIAVHRLGGDDRHRNQAVFIRIAGLGIQDMMI